MKRLLAVLMMVMASTVYATGNSNNSNPSTSNATGIGVGIGVGVAESNASAAALAGSVSRATGGHAAAIAGGGSATGYGGDGGNSYVNIDNRSPGSMKYSGSIRTPGYAPDIVANPTAPCRIAVGAGVSVMGGGGSVVGSVLDEGCDARADATMLVMMGYEGAAAARLCQKPEMAKALGPVVCPGVTENAAVTSNNSNPMFKH